MPFAAIELPPADDDEFKGVSRERSHAGLRAASRWSISRSPSRFETSCSPSGSSTASSGGRHHGYHDRGGHPTHAERGYRGRRVAAADAPPRRSRTPSCSVISPTTSFATPATRSAPTHSRGRSSTRPRRQPFPIAGRPAMAAAATVTATVTVVRAARAARAMVVMVVMAAAVTATTVARATAARVEMTVGTAASPSAGDDPDDTADHQLDARRVDLLTTGYCLRASVPLATSVYGQEVRLQTVSSGRTLCPCTLPQEPAGTAAPFDQYAFQYDTIEKTREAAAHPAVWRWSPRATCSARRCRGAASVSGSGNPFPLPPEAGLRRADVLASGPLRPRHARAAQCVRGPGRRRHRRVSGRGRVHTSRRRAASRGAASRSNATSIRPRRATATSRRRTRRSSSTCVAAELVAGRYATYQHLTASAGTTWKPATPGTRETT